MEARGLCLVLLHLFCPTWLSLEGLLYSEEETDGEWILGGEEMGKFKYIYLIIYMRYILRCLLTSREGGKLQYFT